MLAPLALLVFLGPSNPEEAWWWKEIAFLKTEDGFYLGAPDGLGSKPRNRYAAAWEVFGAYTSLRFLIYGLDEQKPLLMKARESEISNELELLKSLPPAMAKIQRLVGEFPKEFREFGIDIADVNLELRFTKEYHARTVKEYLALTVK